MKKLLFGIILLLTGIVKVEAQEPVDVYGYFETQIMGAMIDESFNHVQSNKLRVDLSSDISDKIAFSANFDYITYHGKKRWNVLNYLSDDIVSQVPQNMRQFYVLPFNDRDFLDNAFVEIAFKHMDLTAGKQQISLGTGYAWNPTDVFNVKDLLDPTYEQPGHNAIRLDVPIGLKYTVSALYAPEDVFSQSAKMLRFKGRIGHFDYIFTGIETRWTYTDYTQLSPEHQGFSSLPENRQLLGVATSGELLGLGVWAEYAWNEMERTGDFYGLVVGTNYTFDFQTYVMLEFFRNTLGKTDSDEYNLNDWMRFLSSEQKALSRDQLYFLVQHPLTDFIDGGISSIYSLSDNSVVIAPTIDYSFAQNVQITAYLNFNIGEEGTAYSDMQGNGGLIRAKVYF